MMPWRLGMTGARCCTPASRCERAASLSEADERALVGESRKRAWKPASLQLALAEGPKRERFWVGRNQRIEPRSSRGLASGAAGLQMRAAVLVPAPMRSAAREEVRTPLLGRSGAAALAIAEHQARAPEALPTHPHSTTPLLRSRVLALFLQVRPPHVCTGGNNRVRFWPRSNVAQRGIPHLCPPPKGTLLATFERGAERRSARLTWALLRMTTKPVQSASTGVSARPLDVGAASRGRPDRGRLAWAGDRSLRTTLPV